MVSFSAVFGKLLKSVFFPECNTSVSSASKSSFIDLIIQRLVFSSCYSGTTHGNFCCFCKLMRQSWANELNFKRFGSFFALARYNFNFDLLTIYCFKVGFFWCYPRVQSFRPYLIRLNWNFPSKFCSCKIQVTFAWILILKGSVKVSRSKPQLLLFLFWRLKKIVNPFPNVAHYVGLKPSGFQVYQELHVPLILRGASFLFCEPFLWDLFLFTRYWT